MIFSEVDIKSLVNKFNNIGLVELIENKEDVIEDLDPTITLMRPTNNLRDIKCWWCRFPISMGIVIGVPVSYRYCSDTSSHIFCMEGYTCSFSCTLAYILSESTHNYSNSIGLLILLYQLVNIKSTHVIIPKASSWKMTQEWGGDWTRADYLKNKYTTKEGEFKDIAHYRNNIHLQNIPISRENLKKPLQLV